MEQPTTALISLCPRYLLNIECDRKCNKAHSWHKLIDKFNFKTKKCSYGMKCIYAILGCEEFCKGIHDGNTNVFRSELELNREINAFRERYYGRGVNNLEIEETRKKLKKVVEDVKYEYEYAEELKKKLSQTEDYMKRMKSNEIYIQKNLAAANEEIKKLKKENCDLRDKEKKHENAIKLKDRTIELLEKELLNEKAKRKADCLLDKISVELQTDRQS